MVASFANTATFSLIIDSLGDILQALTESNVATRERLSEHAFEFQGRHRFPPTSDNELVRHVVCWSSLEQTTALVRVRRTHGCAKTDGQPDWAINRLIISSRTTILTAALFRPVAVCRTVVAAMISHYSSSTESLSEQNIANYGPTLSCHISPYHSRTKVRDQRFSRPSVKSLFCGLSKKPVAGDRGQDPRQRSKPPFSRVGLWNPCGNALKYKPMDSKKSNGL